MCMNSFTLIGNDQSQIFESQGLLKFKTIEDLNDQKDPPKKLNPYKATNFVRGVETIDFICNIIFLDFFR